MSQAKIRYDVGLDKLAFAADQVTQAITARTIVINEYICYIFVYEGE